ncbi:hypothetical protein Acsp01_32120 [Actinoplanes sp. NBRC 101535]|nr:hypothetical protein Acsp01_32120 [Actinoplanes sp. NBRC 101535]
MPSGSLAVLPPLNPQAAESTPRPACGQPGQPGQPGRQGGKAARRQGGKAARRQGGKAARRPDHVIGCNHQPQQDGNSTQNRDRGRALKKHGCHHHPGAPQPDGIRT